MTTKKAFLSGMALATSIFLAGCAQDWTSVTSLHDENILNYYNYAAGGKTLRTDVIGNPFPTAETGNNTLPDTIVSQMQGQTWGTPTTLVTSRDTPDPDFYIVLRLNPARDIGIGTVCGARDTSLPPSDELHMMMAFCAGDEAKSSVETWMKQPKSPDAPAFADAIKSMTRNLIPSSDPRDRRDCNAIDCP